MDRQAFKTTLGGGEANAGLKFQQVLENLDEKLIWLPEVKWLAKVDEAARLPIGPIEAPRGDGQPLSVRHLPNCRLLTVRLHGLAAQESPGRGLEHLTQILVLSRCMRLKASLEAYQAGVESEAIGLEGMEKLLRAHGRTDPKLMRRALDELIRHVAETPPPVDCLKTECYRAGGFVLVPNSWTFELPGAGGPQRIPEPWLTRGLVLSMELPWESERKTRLWQAVWAGLFRTIETPHWQLPQDAAVLIDATPATQRILRGWLPAADGSSLTGVQLARLLDASWLSNERLFCPVEQLHAAASRSHWQVEARRQAAALQLYQLEERKIAQKLDDLVPKYLPVLPVDPYSGKAFSYRISAGEQIENLGAVPPGDGILWSTGADGIDNGGRRDGPLPQDNGLDLITVVPSWP
jgi:hypothetical protein